MTTKLLDTLNESDLQLVRQTSLDELRNLDEDALLDLHAQVRRARNKHVGVYRRQAAARVQRKGARGLAREGNQRNVARAEIFEDALSRVSRQLGVVARESARELKAERLALAKSDNPPAAPARAARTSGAKPVVKKPTLSDKTREKPGRIKREAGSKAAGARRQAKRDAR
jgi:hypothetical protein